MDRRWPWKKKSSDKAAATATTLSPAASQGDEGTLKEAKYVQISVESYSSLTGLENQVITYDEQVRALENEINDLKEKLSAANSEITAKEDLVKQHTKVAGEAVSGWEKAEAEALALKNSLESVTLSKLTAEDKASHLDDALKECMWQIRILKEEHEQKLQDVVISKNKQCEKIKLELEAKLAHLDQELLESEADNDAISRSLQERSNTVIKISEEKSRAEAEIERLKGNIESCEREINSLKYEIHVLSKELEIRNEEKNMSMSSAEAANKQHMEGVKKIAKLEAECQRLRGLVRKKLPGPAALAQMKLEVGSIGRDYGDTRFKRSPSGASTPHLSTVTDFSIDNAQKSHKEHQFLADRLLAMEEETKMLKEALAIRNSELLASRNLCAKTSRKPQTLEAQLDMSNQQRSPSKAFVQIPTEVYLSQTASNPPSMTSLSEDGNDDDRSCSETSAIALISGLSQFKKENGTVKSNKTENAMHLDIMHDFLEMEKLACSLKDSSANGKTTSETVKRNTSGEISCKELHSEKQHDLSPPANHISDTDNLSVTKLRARLLTVLQSTSRDVGMRKILEDIKHVVQDASEILNQHSINGVSEEVHAYVGTCNGQTYSGGGSLTEEKKNPMSPGDRVTSETVRQELATALSHIHDYVRSLEKEARAVGDISSDGKGLSYRIDEFLVTYDKVLCSNVKLDDFVFDLSAVLGKASELRFNVLGFKGNEVQISSPDCIDKVALTENKVTQNDSLGRSYQNGSAHFLNPTSNTEVHDDGNMVSEYQPKQTNEFSLEEFRELKSQLHETEQLLAETKSQLVCAQRSNSLAETQLKCMTESYRALETRANELETEVNLLQVKIEALESELQDEKRCHHDAFARCKELEEQLQRNDKCFVCSSADNDLKSKQEKELAEKLAECQENILLLGKQLKAFHPQTDIMGSPYNERSGNYDPDTSCIYLQDLYQTKIDSVAVAWGTGSGTGAESPMESFNIPCSPSDTEATPLRSPINSNPRSTMSSSSSSSSTPIPEKHSRGFSRFFSSKGKNDH
ncbi:Filament-like plant protein 4 [Hibiscus syriacus]|uniref:Filament-like plant protein 4 n=1 Tax=Hibiscus syriacus TaxID=106335 RepID=A0A6A2XDC9_HIBSY|nr:filament-like plant protein 4 [Hibiscus syriacus]XP_039052903.1 filament-like plant protein 4 [Hibiscus syriacus]XP_039052904.1 filament-like plant protein 4 [Hibiscus syriacus]KAE8656439.1 Filament-like plant protein 4 [Hibiscus syriacus]